MAQLLRVNPLSIGTPISTTAKQPQTEQTAKRVNPLSIGTPISTHLTSIEENQTKCVNPLSIGTPISTAMAAIGTPISTAMAAMMTDPFIIVSIPYLSGHPFLQVVCEKVQK